MRYTVTVHTTAVLIDYQNSLAILRLSKNL